MAAAIGLRDDYDAARLRELAKHSQDADQTRRLMALAVVYEGGLRSDGAQAGGVGLQTFRDWVVRFNADGPAGLVNGKAPGQAPRLDASQRRELAQVVEDGPIPAIHGVVRWRLCDLVQWVQETHSISVSEDTVSRYLRAMGYRKLSARPRHHAQNPEALTAFKKRMARPVCKRFLRSDLISLRQRIRPVSIALAKMEIRASWSS
jgi:transposase